MFKFDEVHLSVLFSGVMFWLSCGRTHFDVADVAYSSRIHLVIFSLIEVQWLKILWYFLLCNKVIQSYIYTHLFSLRFYYHIDYHQMLARVPWVIQKIPVGQSFHIPQCICISQSQTPSPSSPWLVSFGNHKFFQFWESVSVPQISSFVSSL